MRGVSRDSLAAARADIEEQLGEKPATVQRQVAEELFGVVHLLEGNPRLRRLLSDPAAGVDQRARLASDLLGTRVSAETSAVVDLVVRSSWSVPADLVDATDDLAAQALFAVEEQAESLDELEDELFRFGRILDREPGLRSALTDPSLPADRKNGLLDALLGEQVRGATLMLVREVVLHPRGRTIDRALEEYGRLAAARRERLVAQVTSVLPLSEEQLRRLSDALAAQLGHRVHLNVEIDPALVGGVTVRVGDQIFDGSIAHRLGLARHLMAR